MAIDDNTIYGLTGAQIKELPGKIEAVKGLARELTTEDYNYPADNPTSVALWLLEPGIYTRSTADGVAVRYGTEVSQLLADNEKTALVTGPTATGSKNYLVLASNNVIMRIIHSTSSGGDVEVQRVLDSSSVINNLISTLSSSPLAASQGKVLKDLVDSLAIRGAGAPTTSTAGQVGTLYEDTTNGDLYICTDATNPYVWEEVGAGGGGGGTSGVKQLTTSDCNWPVDNPDGIAPWLLDLGWYITSDNLKIYSSGTSTSYSISMYGQTFYVGRGNGNGAGFRFVFRIGSGAATPTTQWAGSTYTRWFDDNGDVTATEYLVGSKRLDERISRRVNAPSSSSQGVLGEFWTDKQTGKTYKCVGADDVSGVYDWEEAITNPSGLLINGGTTAPTTATVGVVGTQYTYVDTTGTPTAHLCVCVEIDNTDPSNPVYTWQTLI